MNSKNNNSVALLRKLSGQENCYTIPKLYVQLTGCHVRALILNQLIFYSDKSTRHENGWFDKDYDEWETQTLVKERTLRNILNEFKEKKWAETKVKRVYGKTKLTCRPILENILSDLEPFLHDQPAKFSDPSPVPVRQNLPDDQTAKFSDPYLYTDKTTDKTKPPISPIEKKAKPEKPRTKQPESSKAGQESSFESFWNLYPVKKAKKKCQEIWKRKKLNAIVDDILENLQNQIDNDAHFKEGFIPNPSTYLTQERWEDEITKPKTDYKREEQIKKNEENKKRIEEQARISRLNAEKESEKYNRQKQQAKAFQDIKKKVKSGFGDALNILRK